MTITTLVLLVAQVQMSRLADGVYAALQPERLRFWDANSVVIVGDSGVLVVDAQGNPVFARTLLEEIRKLTDKPVRAVIATHHHTDHIWSFDVYRKAFPAVELIGHRSLRNDVPELSAPQLKTEIEGLSAALAKAPEDLASKTGDERRELEQAIEEAQARLDALREIEVWPPSVTYTERLTLHDGRKVELHHFQGHTAGDTVLFLPAEKILITGDFVDEMPSGRRGYLLEWIQALDELERFDFEIPVPGHGAVHRGKDQLKLVRELLSTIVSEAETAVDAGRSLEELQASIELDRFRERLAGDDALKTRVYNRFIPQTVERAYQYFSASR